MLSKITTAFGKIHSFAAETTAFGKVHSFAAEDCFTFLRTVDLPCVLYHIYVPWEENFI